MLRFLAAAFLTLSLSACAEAQESNVPPILVDQFGYLPNLNKIAVIKDPQIGFDAGRNFTPSGRYAVIDRATGQVAHQGTPKAWRGGATDKNSGDRVWHYDFSSVTKPGRYVVRDLDRGVDSYGFEISPNVYTPLLKTAFKTLYLQRAGFEKRAPFAPAGFADKASHLGPGQDPQSRLFSQPDNAATERDLRGGWYDAGDYNKYTSWTANYVTWLLAAYLENPAVWTDDFGIPESGNGVPDILDEVRWGLAWLERMQNRDGAMLSVQGLSEASPPSKATGPSLYGPPNTSATVTSAGAFAMAAKVYGTRLEFAGDAARYAKRARAAWQWASKNPSVKFYNNDERSNSLQLAAGQQEVEPDRLAKKWLIAAIHMDAMKPNAALAREIQALYDEVKPMDAATPNGFEGYLAFEMLYHARQPKTSKAFAKRIRRDYEANLLNGYNAWPTVVDREDPYGAYVDGYWWGSNSTKSRRGSVFTQAVHADLGDRPARDYMNAGAGYLHYLHGVNPLGKSYLSNMGGQGAENSVSQFYHIWYADKTDWDEVGVSKYGPAPGFLVGGPNDSYERDACCATGCGGYGARMCKIPVKRPPTGQPPAKSYTDFNEGWPLNSWSVTENSNSYQIAYLRLLSKYAR
jgi:hypothetical protein